MLEIKQCPICEGDTFRPFLTCTDYTVSKRDFNIVECTSCGFKLTNPVPDADAIGAYYQSEDYVSHSNTNKGLINSLYQMIRRRTIRQKGEKIIRHFGKKTGSILDYGAGTGTFLAHMKSIGWETVGLEPSPEARLVAEKEYQILLHPPEHLHHLPANSADVITLWHVLEHVHTLNETLARLTQILKNDGLMVIAVPNCTAYEAQVFGRHWAAYDVPRHLYHFSIETMTRLLAKHGLQVEDQNLMPFDSFYVSMLSNKYKTGSTNLINSFLTGLKSNLKAGSDLHYGSSITYWIRKKR